MTKFFLFLAFFALIAVSPAQARHHSRHHGGRFHVHRVHSHWRYAPRRDQGFAEADDWSRPTRYEGRGHRARYSGGRGLSAPCATARRLGGPCGCFASELLFGHSVRGLWLAANWFRFPSAAPGAGMVAVRSHHVMAIIEAHGDGTATISVHEVPTDRLSMMLSRYLALFAPNGYVGVTYSIEGGGPPTGGAFIVTAEGVESSPTPDDWLDANAPEGKVKVNE